MFVLNKFLNKIGGGYKRLYSKKYSNRKLRKYHIILQAWSWNQAGIQKIVISRLVYALSTRNGWLFSCRWNGRTADLIPRNIPPSPFALNLSIPYCLHTTFTFWQGMDIYKQFGRQCVIDAFFFWNEKKTWHLWKKATESHPLKMIPVHLVCSFQARPLKHWHVTKHACQLQVTCHRVSNPTLLLHAVPLGDRAISAYRSTQVDLRSAQWRGLRG